MKHLLIFLTTVILVSHASQATGVETMLNYHRVTKLIDDLAPGDGPGIQYIIVDKDKVISASAHLRKENLHQNKPPSLTEPAEITEREKILLF